MNKIDLIKTLSTTTDISKIEATKIVNLFFEQMTSALEKDDRVEIRGLCSFYVKNYPGAYGKEYENRGDCGNCAEKVTVL